MKNKISAGILLFRFKNDSLEVFLGHSGGPLWKNIDEGGWTIPKGGVIEGESLLEAALREFFEETGLLLEEDRFLYLTEVKLKKGKRIHVWIKEGNFEPSTLESKLFEMEYPKNSGKTAKFPELDKVQWFKTEEAKVKIHPSQIEIIELLKKELPLTLH